MIAIPALGGLIQARRREDIEREACDYIVVTGDIAPSQVEVVVASMLVDGVDYSAELRNGHEERARADELVARARERQKAIAMGLSSAGVPMRDMGGMLGVSHQRVQQLIATSTGDTSAA